MRIALGVLGLIVFLVISAFVARWLTTDNAERTQVIRLLQAQARGDAGGMVRQLSACAPGCAAEARANARRLRRPGPIQIVAYDSATPHALTTPTRGTRGGRKTPQTLTPVQCGRARRTPSA